MQFSDLTITYMLNKAALDRTAAVSSLSDLLQNPNSENGDMTDDLHKRIDNELDKLVDAESRMQAVHKYFVSNQPGQPGQPGQAMGQGMPDPQQNPQASPVHFQESDFKSAQPEEKPNYTLKL